MTGGHLLDANVVSELRNGPRADAGVRAWSEKHAADRLSVLVVGELRRGVELLRCRDAQAGELLANWLGTVTTVLGDRILPFTTEVCERWALLSVPVRPVSPIVPRYWPTPTRAPTTTVGSITSRCAMY